jgi:hypothetical protein
MKKKNNKSYVFLSKRKKLTELERKRRKKERKKEKKLIEHVFIIRDFNE